MASTKKIVDVAHPGKSAPSATSKPVIVSNRPLIKDPMVNANETAPEAKSEAAATAPGAPPLAKAHRALVVQPISTGSEAPEAAVSPAETGPAVTEPAAKAEPTTAPTLAPKAAAGVAPIPEEPAPTEPKQAAEPATEAKPQPAAAPASPVATYATPPPASGSTAPRKTDIKVPDNDPDHTAKLQAEQHAKLEKLIESQRYYLPIDSVEKRRAKRFVLLGLVLSILLILAWVDIALDAGLIHIDGLRPVTHLFSN